MPLCALSASPLRHLTPALPLEIIDYIIDFLWNDRTTLQACSLTSRAFRREAQLHLFWSLNIGKATTDSCPRLRAFKTHEGLASLIRHISYVEDQQDCSWDDLASSLPSHLSSNTRPRTAYFAVRYNPTAVNRPRVSSHEVPLDPFTSPLWSNLHTLTLRGVTFQDCGHFGRAILPLRGLKVLELDPVAINPYCDGAPVIGPEFDGVCALRISFVGMSSLAAILPWLAAGAARGNVALQAVSVPLLLGDNTALLQLLWYFARSLTMLRLVSAANAGDNIWPSLAPAISRCSQLRVLSIDACSPVDPTICKHLAGVISGSPNMALIHLDLGDMGHDFHALESLDWGVMDKAAKQGNCATHLQINISAPSRLGENSEGRMRGSIAKKFQHLETTGRFRLVVRNFHDVHDSDTDSIRGSE